jgi:DNA repair exonuclease SbcCD ATPase subunit
MKSIIIAGLIGTLLFSVSAIGSWFVFKPKSEPVASDPVSEFDGKLPMVDTTKAQEQMPLGIRPDVPMPPSVALDLMNSIIQSEKKLQEKEERLKKEEKRISLLREDLERERSELDSFSKKIDSKINEAKEATNLLKLEKEAVKKEVKELSMYENRLGKKVGDLASEELKQQVNGLKDIFRTLDPARAAEILKAYADRGNLNLVANLLDSLEDRQKAKIIAELDSPTLTAEIMDTLINPRPAGATPIKSFRR